MKNYLFFIRTTAHVKTKEKQTKNVKKCEFSKI